MDDTITTIYCLCDDFLKAIGHRDDLQVGMSTAEVMTVPLVAATFFGANIDKTRLFLHEYGYVKKMLGKSRLNRRIHAIEPTLWRVLFELLAGSAKSWWEAIRSPGPCGWAFFSPGLPGGRASGRADGRRRAPRPRAG